MGCRSFLSAWKDEKGEYKFEGRFNQGVVSFNLLQIGDFSGKEDSSWKLLEERVELCHEALLVRHEVFAGYYLTYPAHWQHGAIARCLRARRLINCWKVAIKFS